MAPLVEPVEWFYILRCCNLLQWYLIHNHWQILLLDIGKYIKDTTILKAKYWHGDIFLNKTFALTFQWLTMGENINIWEIINGT